MSKGKLICFIGLDGAGKSTLSNSLQSYFLSKGMKTKIIWVKLGVPIINIPKIVYKLVLIFSKSRSRNDKSSDKSDISPFKIPKNPIIRKLYLIYILLDHWFQILTKVRMPLIFGYYVICDRYIADSIVDLVVNFGIKYEDAKSTIKKFIGIPKPDYAFYIKVPPEVAFMRKNEGYLLEYLTSKENIYSKIADDNEFNIITLDGTLDKDALFKKVIDLLTHKYV